MPYAPGNWGVYSQGLANLAGGISQGVEGVAGGLKDWSAKRDLTKSLRGMFSSVDPENKAMYETMGLPQLQGKLQSYSMQHTMNVLAEEKQRTTQEAAIGSALQRYSAGPPAPALDPGGEMQMSTYAAANDPAGETMSGGQNFGAALRSYEPNHEERVRYALQTPGLGGTGAVRLLGTLENYRNLRTQNLLPLGSVVPLGEYGAVVGTGTANHFAAASHGANRDAFFNRSDLEGAADVKGAPGWKRVTTGPNTSQLVYAAGAPPEAAAILDSEGNPTGQLAYFEGKTGKWVKMDDSNYNGPALRVVDESGNVINDVLYHPRAKKVIDLRSEISKNLGSYATKPSDKEPTKAEPKKGLFDDYKDWLKLKTKK